MPGVIRLNPDCILYDDEGHPISVILDGSTYRLQTEAKLATGHGLATETKQDTLEATLTEIEADTDHLDVALSTLATETTLSGIQEKLNEIELDTDQLDVPLSTLATESTASGILAQADAILAELEQKTEPDDLQKTVLHDSLGTEIGSVTISGEHRLQVDSHTQLWSGDEGPVDILTDHHNVDRLAVNARLAPGQSIIIGNSVTPDLSKIKREYLMCSGCGTSMKVDGSVTPIIFEFEADETYDLELYELRFIFGAQDILFEGNKFASKAELPNGLLIEIVTEYGTYQVANIRINEDFLMLPTPANYILNNTGPKDILVMGMSLGGAPKLRAGTSDVVRVTVRDDLDESEIATLKAQVFAVKE